MKKLTGLIALILLFSVSLFILASCGDKTESQGESAASSTGSASTASTEASGDTISDTSGDTTPETSEEESKVDIFTYEIDRTKTKTNVAAGKTYEYTAGAPAANYPDEDDKTLTDGVKPEIPAGVFSDAMWVGIEKEAEPTIVVDLDEVVEAIADFDVCILYEPGPGIQVPASMTVSVSEDGETYHEVGKIALSAEDLDLEEGVTAASFIASIAPEKGVKAQFVKFQFEVTNWFFFSELEVSVYK